MNLFRSRVKNFFFNYLIVMLLLIVLIFLLSLIYRFIFPYDTLQIGVILYCVFVLVLYDLSDLSGVIFRSVFG